MAPRKAQPKYSPAEKALRQQYGGYIKNTTTGVTKKATTADLVAGIGFNDPNSPNYRPTDPGAFGETPFSIGGTRIGTYNNQTGAFSVAGAGRAPGAGPKKKLGAKSRATKKRRGGSAGKGLDEPLSIGGPFAEADLSTTSYLRTQGKAYAAGRAARAGTAAGATSTPTTAKKRPARKKGMLKKKGRAGSVMRPTIKISKGGKVTPNRGGRKPRRNK